MDYTDYISPFTDYVNVAIGVVSSLFAYIFGDRWVLFFVFLMLNIGDFVTRWIAAYLTGTESSDKGWKGILKKLCYWIMIALAFGMSVIFIDIGEVLGLNLGITVLLGWFVLTSLIINEARSILENIVDAGFHPPVILIKGLEAANSAVEKFEDSIINDEKEHETEKEEE